MESTLERQGGGLEDDCWTVVDEAKEAHGTATTDTRNTGLTELPGSWVLQCNKTPSSSETNICLGCLVDKTRWTLLRNHLSALKRFLTSEDEKLQVDKGRQPSFGKIAQI